MSLVSFEFLAFFFMVLILYYIFPKKLRWTVLLLFSVFYFYRASGLKLFLVFVCFCFMNWGTAILVSNFEKAGKQREKKIAYITTIILDAAILIAFKDLNFFKRTANGISEMAGHPLNIPDIHIIAPIGISYFALILIGYLTDVYWKKYEPERGFLRFTLFSGYFPQLSSGPFVRYDKMKEELFTAKRFDYSRIILGIERIIWGFFKKLVLSERLGIIVNMVYSNYQVYDGWYIILATLAFTFQLYTDFSGAMDIVIGISECLGITLPENFDAPFYSTSIEEFWRRWHITLGAWLREYVFYPLLRSNLFRKLKKWCKKKWGKDYEKKFNLPMYMGMFFTWFLIGFWHGGKWNYIWGSGLYYWLLITASNLMTPVWKWFINILKINTKCYSYKLFQRIRTLLLFTFGLSFFRAENLREGIRMWKSAFPFHNIEIFLNGSLTTFGLDKGEWTIIFISLLILFIAGIIKNTTNKEVWQWLNEQNMIFRWFVLIIFLLLIIIFGKYGPGVDASEFIYQQF